MHKLKIGDIAYCERGYLGVITKKQPVGTLGVLYKGIHLTDDFFGQNWQSKNPRVIANMSTILTGLKDAENKI